MDAGLVGVVLPLASLCAAHVPLDWTQEVGAAIVEARNVLHLSMGAVSPVVRPHAFK
jgi:hypothetical protein